MSGFGSVGEAVFGEVVCLFQPSYAHTQAERRRLALTVEHPEAGAPGTRVDLDSGVIVITLPSASGAPLPTG